MSVSTLTRTVVALLLYLLVLLSGVQYSLNAQDFSEKQELAIFRLSYYGQPEPITPSGAFVRIEMNRDRFSFQFQGTGQRHWDRIFQNAFASIDERIRSVFVNLGRFEVVGFPQRLQADHVDDFIRTIREYRSDELEMSEAVLLGQQAFTEEDFRRLSGGFIVVVPSVTWYAMHYDHFSGRYVAEIETSFTVLDVDSGRTVDQFRVETSGSDVNSAAAVRSAVGQIPTRLSFEVRSVSVFQIRTGIIDREGDRVYIEFGRNMGVVRGDEFAVVRSRTGRTGYTDEVESGLIVVSNVYEQYSVGRLVYVGGNGADVGDQLREVPRRGWDIGVYGHSLLSVGGSGLSSRGGILGIQAIANRGYYRIKPFVAVEIPFVGAQSHVLVGGYVGFETSLYARRFRLGPTAQLGAIVANRINSDSDPFASHLGGKVGMNLNFQAGRDTILGAQAGWMQMWRTDAAAGRDIGTIQGPYIGGSLSFR